MHIVEEIAKWAGNLPTWQAFVVDRLLKYGELDSDDEAEAFSLLLAQHNIAGDVEIARTKPTLNLETYELPAIESQNVKLIALRDLCDVNAIDQGQCLSFGAQGITLIYGKNGSGKSGYARVLKRACRARDQKESIHPNVYAAKKLVPSATFDLEVDGQPVFLHWQAGVIGPEELAGFAVFDSRCARMYVDEKNAVQYVPYGMDVFEKLVNVCNRFKQRLSNERDSLEMVPAFLSDFDERTKVGKMIASMSENTEPAAIKALATLSDRELRRYDELTALLKRAELDSPRVQATKLRAVKNRACVLLERLRSLLKVTSARRVQELQQAQSNLRTAKESARLASEKAFNDMPLPGVGSDPWRALFEAARTYSESHAYPSLEFPVISENALCVLCQQHLTEDAKKRFVSFKQFIQDKANQDAENASHELTKLSKAVESELATKPSEFEPTLTELHERDGALEKELRALLDALCERCRIIKSGLETENWAKASHLPAVDLGKFEALISQLEAEALKFDSLEQPNELKELSGEYAELHQRKLVHQHRSAILKLIADRNRLQRLLQCIEGLSTTAITRKNSELMSRVTTDALRDALNREFKLLGLERVNVSLDKSGSKGITFHQLSLPESSSTRVALSEILSEGEQRVVSIASFLAEVSIVPNVNGIILDDPVSSLDHKFREKVAVRLAREGNERQVVVFTHDLVFDLALQDKAAEFRVPLAVRVIRREGEAIGRCGDDLPWESQKVKERIGFLRNMLQEQIQKSVHDPDKYPANVKTFYSRLREAWERMVEEVLLNQTLQRFRPEIHTKKLSMVSVVDHDYLVIDAAMTKCSKLMLGHDDAPSLDSEPPKLDELRMDLEKLSEFVAEVRKRGESIRKTRDELSRAPSGVQN